MRFGVIGAMLRTGACSAVLLCGSPTAGDSGNIPPHEIVSFRTLTIDSSRLSRRELLEDVRQLAATIESTHPDPYVGGGKIAFHRRLHRLLKSIPEGGMTAVQFRDLILPFVGAVQDGHTYVQPITAERPEESPGLPIRFRILAADTVTPDVALYVDRIGVHQNDSLRGARLLALEGVRLESLVQRQRRLAAYENEFHNLQNLVRTLATGTGVRSLLPEWLNSDTLSVTLLPPGAAEARGFRLALAQPPDSPADRSAIRLPATRAGEPSYAFADSERKVALLRLDNTWAYREAFEYYQRAGSPVNEWARAFYRRYHEGAEPPSDLTDLVTALPAASETLGRLVEEMSDAHTETLVVDLRRNGGGHSMLVEMLIYYLYGRQGWRVMNEGYAVRRYSDLYFQSQTDVTLESLNQDRDVPLEVGDYDFTQEDAGADSTASREAGNERLWRRASPTFAAELEKSEHESYYLPPRLVIVTSPATFSGGFWLAAALSKLGGELVGVPSGQAGNAFGDALFFTLRHSGLGVAVSSQFYVLFPDQAEGMKVLAVDKPLTYDRWRELGFDPNASIVDGVSGDFLPCSEAGLLSCCHGGSITLGSVTSDRVPVRFEREAGRHIR